MSPEEIPHHRKNCDNCRYENTAFSDEPCSSCKGFDEWEAKPETCRGSCDDVQVTPSHYPAAGTAGDVIAAALRWNLGFCEGNIIKYLVRWKRKGGLEDLKKARTYLERLIDRAEADQAKVEAN